MSPIPQSERKTQDRVIELFREDLGYGYLGNWKDRSGNDCIEEERLAPWLRERGASAFQVERVLYALRQAVSQQGKTLYEANQATYHLLRYGVQVKEPGQTTTTVSVIDWLHPLANNFCIAEEVSLVGANNRRPDLVLYVNGIALGVIELKNSRVSLGDGIRQLISNQRPDFNAWFFSTAQILFAGNDSEGLRYGTVGTEEKYYLTWKEDEQDNSRLKLDKYLLKMCGKQRFIELLYDFVLFDGGVKKLPRVHQYFGIKAAQEQVRERKGGIIWHTQGSGKSIVMVYLAKWILETNPFARIAVITDRDELDKQILGVFGDAGVAAEKATSGRDLLKKLAQAQPRLLCSLVHKFGRRDVEDLDAFIRDLDGKPSVTRGEIFVFVDECHRTQSGKLHRLMKAMMPQAVFIGFTGTPLLKKDKATSMEVFGEYIHTYKFAEAVEDEVVLDLEYEARDIDQRLGSPEKIDAWFEARTQNLNDWQRDELKKHWGTLQQVLSSRSRMDQVVRDILHDFGTQPRLSGGKGNAILVASSIYEATKYFSIFQQTPFKGKCAVVTSYDPQAGDISKEDTGANSNTDKSFLYETYEALLKGITPHGGMTRTEVYEEEAKRRFVKEPATMKLLVVVDKLLTGFDAPSCSYLYIDKSMRDHGLFQAICRTNRLDGEDKTCGVVVDYKDLFTRVEEAISVYSSELDHSAGGASPDILMSERMDRCSKRLDDALEAFSILCEEVEPPRDELKFIQNFCGNTELPEDLKAHEPQRAQFYKTVASLVRAYANLATELDLAGYTPAQISQIQSQVKAAVALRDCIRLASQETLDLKTYESDMRHLIDTYIEADHSKVISPFAGMGLLDVIVKTGIADAIKQEMSGLKGNKDAIAETIENNVRSKIIKDHLKDPDFYERMSALLAEIIRDRKQKAIEYEAYLKRIAELVKDVTRGRAADVPASLSSPGKVAFYHFFLSSEVKADRAAEPGPEFNDLKRKEAEALALKIDRTVRQVKPDNFRGNHQKEQVIKAALYGVLQDEAKVHQVFTLMAAQDEY